MKVDVRYDLESASIFALQDTNLVTDEDFGIVGSNIDN
jgi:hypothetical protein